MKKCDLKFHHEKMGSQHDSTSFYQKEYSNLLTEQWRLSHEDLGCAQTKVGILGAEIACNKLV
jgi:hypothetical protein